MELGEPIQYSDGVADQLRLITEELNCEILGNQWAMYEAVKDLITQNLWSSAEIYTFVNLCAIQDPATFKYFKPS
jgi:hypothetical protein